MYWYFLIVACLSFSHFPRTAPTFRSQQLTHPRVQTAYREKEVLLQQLLKSKRLNPDQIEIYIRAFKFEETLEVWAKNKNQARFTLLKQYPFCASSGVLGPKNRQGDGQIPEGLYLIDRFNPASNFYLSLGIDYPNTADRRRNAGKPAKYLGGDIFIHGDCVTVGCIPLTNDKIKELYLLAVEARSNGQQRIPVHIFPARFTPGNWQHLKLHYARQPEMLRFWANLQSGYAQFEQQKKLPAYAFGKSGEYVFH